MLAHRQYQLLVICSTGSYWQTACTCLHMPHYFICRCRSDIIAMKMYRKQLTLLQGAAFPPVHSAERFVTELNGCAGACPQDDKVVAVLWLACHDPFEDNAEAAATLWEYSGADLASSFVPALAQYLGHPNTDVRSAAAAALAAGLQVRFTTPGCTAYMMCCWSL